MTENTIPVINYLPVEKRIPNTQYLSLLEKILKKGRKVNPIHGEFALMLVGEQLRFPMEHGFPLLTERDLSKTFPGAIGELVGFLNGAQTIDELQKYGCPRIFWDRWVTKEKCAFWGLEEGDLGSASYGAIWTRCPTRDGKTFNQIENVIRQIREMPQLRTHTINTFYPPEVIGPKGTRKVVVAPCHGDVHILVFPETKELILHHKQRSGDMPTGIPLDIIEYAALGMMLAQVLGYTFTELVYSISDAHIYECQIPKVKELLTREPRSFPTVTLDSDIKNIFDFRREHFHLDDYNPNPKIIFPTPV